MQHISDHLVSFNMSPKSGTDGAGSTCNSRNCTTLAGQRTIHGADSFYANVGQSFENHAEISEFQADLRNKLNYPKPSQNDKAIPRTPDRTFAPRKGIRKLRERSLSEESSGPVEENVSFSACFFHAEDDDEDLRKSSHMANARDNAFGAPSSNFSELSTMAKRIMEKQKSTQLTTFGSLFDFKTGII